MHIPEDSTGMIQINCRSVHRKSVWSRPTEKLEHLSSTGFLVYKEAGSMWVYASVKQHWEQKCWETKFKSL